MVKKGKEEAMVWQDKTGKYKLGYSQYLQMQQLRTERLLLITVLILIALLIGAFYYFDLLIQRVDAMDVFSKMAG